MMVQSMCLTVLMVCLVMCLTEVGVHPLKISLNLPSLNVIKTATQAAKIAWQSKVDEYNVANNQYSRRGC